MAENIELDISLAALKLGLADLKEEFKEVGKVGDTAFGTVGDEVTTLTKEMQDLISVQREVGVDIKKLEGASAGLGNRIKTTIRDTQVFGKSIGEWGNQFTDVTGKMGGTVKASGAVSGAFKLVGLAVKATGLGLLVGVIGSLITYFTKFQSGIDKVSQITSALSAVVDVLVNRFLSLASAVGNFFSGNFSAAADNLAGAFTGIATEIANAATAAYDLEKAFQQLRDDSRTAGVEFARQGVALAKLKAIADDETRSIGARSAAQKQANALEQQGLNTKLGLSAKQLENDQKLFFQHTEDAALRDKAAASEIEYYGVVAEVNAAQIEGEKALTALQKEAAAARKKIRDQEAADEKKRAELRVAVVSDEYEKQIAAEQLRYDRLLADLNKYFKGRAELLGLVEQAEKQHKNNIADIFLGQAEDAQKRLEELQKLRSARDDFEKEANKKNLDAAKKNIEDIRKLQDSEIDVTEQNFNNYIAVLESSGASKEKVAEKQLEFDKAIEGERIRVAIEAQEALLAITADGDANQVELIENKIALLKSQLEGLNIAPAKEKKKGNFLLDALGIGPEDEDEFKKAVSQAIKGIEELNAARLQAAQVAVEAAEEQVAASEDNVVAAQEALDQEIELAALGFASDVTNKKAELDLANQAAADAKVREAKALEDRKKAQRAQILLDSLFQVSNLVTASTNVISGFSAIPIFGVPLGIAAVALMVGAFIKSKASALQAVKARKGIQGRAGSDGLIVGPSHEGGGVPLEVEGGEFAYQDGRQLSIVKKSATAAHFGLLQAINNDDRPAMVGYLERLTGGIQRSDNAATPTTTYQGASGSGASSMALLAKNNELVEENNNLTRKLLKLQEGKEELTDMGDHFIRRQKGRSEVIKKRG